MLLEIFFSKSSLKEKWNWHLTQVVSYFLDLCEISYEILKLNWHRAPKPSTPLVVHQLRLFVQIRGGRFLMPELFLFESVTLVPLQFPSSPKLLRAPSKLTINCCHRF